SLLFFNLKMARKKHQSLELQTGQIDNPLNDRQHVLFIRDATAVKTNIKLHQNTDPPAVPLHLLRDPLRDLDGIHRHADAPAPANPLSSLATPQRKTPTTTPTKPPPRPPFPFISCEIRCATSTESSATVMSARVASSASFCAFPRPISG